MPGDRNGESVVRAPGSGDVALSSPRSRGLEPRVSGGRSPGLAVTPSTCAPLPLLRHGSSFLNRYFGQCEGGTRHLSAKDSTALDWNVRYRGAPVCCVLRITSLVSPSHLALPKKSLNSAVCRQKDHTGGPDPTGEPVTQCRPRGSLPGKRMPSQSRRPNNLATRAIARLIWGRREGCDCEENVTNENVGASRASLAADGTSSLAMSAG